MVKITIYIEGGTVQPLLDKESDTFDNSIFFRESFHHLFSQKFNHDQFELSIQPFGSINRAKIILQSIQDQGIKEVILIDLDGPKTEKEQRLSNNYQNLDAFRIFFMVQEMEAWILSQPSKIEDCLLNDGCIRKRPSEKIENNILLKNKHPEDIEKPSEKLNTILSQYFETTKKKRDKIRKSPKRYIKSKDGPSFIYYLSLQDLSKCFVDVDAIIKYFTASS